MRRLLAPGPVALAILLSAGGCGNERRASAPVAPEPSRKTVDLRYEPEGVSLKLPDNLSVKRTEKPGVFFASFGDTVVSLYAYPRRERLPANATELTRALKRLERATQDRDPSYKLRDSKTTTVAGSRAVELIGDQTIQEEELRTRSVHVYKKEAEYVIELLAPRAEFERLDRQLFEVVLDSLEVTGEVRPRGKG